MKYGNTSISLFYNSTKRRFSSFKFADLKITKTDKYFSKPDYTKSFAWGSYHSDYLLEIDHDVKNGWGKPIISPYHNLSIDPRNQSLHYAIQVFEGLKAYRNGNKVLLFRPELNMIRMNQSASRVGLPNFDGEELIKCITKMIEIEKDWVSDKPGYSLYIRPTFISMSDVLGVQPPKNAKIFVLFSPVGPYFPDGMKPISIICNDSNYVRAFKGGFGQYKLGANYGPTIQLFKEAVNKGYNHILWLTNDNITECGVMNFFYSIRNSEGKEELLTCNLDGTILPGVTRQSVIEICKNEYKIKVTERQLPMSEFIQYYKEKKILEVFCSGTAAVLMPIKEINYQGISYKVLDDNKPCGELTKKLFDYMTKIQYGLIEHQYQRIALQ